MNQEVVFGISLAVFSCVSRPRQLLAGSTYFITRGCAQREFLLTPSPAVLEVFLYCLAVAAARTGVIIHAIIVMSNHYHAVATDPLGRLPEFYAWLHEFVGRALNTHYGREENFWSTTATSVVRLLDADSVLDKIAYTAANPVSAHLVERVDQWPGICLFTPQRISVKRPGFFFRPNGPTPETAELTITAPKIGNWSTRKIVSCLRRMVTEREATRARERKRCGSHVVGADVILAQSVFDKPRAPRAPHTLSPRFASRDKDTRVGALARYKAFLIRHREALALWTSGILDAVFPAGTYMMARRYAVRVADT